ncbi:hypothetical protein OG458_05430 [Streptomyces sp. NBC_01281]|uniref:hypothetical protein n=1 Tax=unclassified Streptomyces TaxID=2593676 RepID=UPI002E129304|nr:hypothetical protein OG458_05430 [Streptomyces sp. NBC_01281]
MHKPLVAAGLTAATAAMLLAAPVASITVARLETPARAGNSVSPTPAMRETDRPVGIGCRGSEAGDGWRAAVEPVACRDLHTSDTH